MRICVYGAASPTIDKKYIEITEEMGKAMVKCNGKGNPRIIEELLRKALDGDC